MIILILVITIIISIPTNAVNDKSFHNISGYINLVTSIQRFYGTRSIYIIYDDTHENFLTTTLIVNIVKRLSAKLVFSQAIGQSSFDKEYNNSISKYSRQLFVIHMANENNTKSFERFASTHSLYFHAWFALFWGTSTKSMLEFCENPTFNRFNLSINTRFLVKCNDGPILREWFYLGKKSGLQVQRIMKWQPDTGLEITNKRGLYVRRKKFNGEIFKMSSIKETNTQQWAEKNYTYMYQVILTEIMHYMNITPVVLQVNSTYGTWNETEKKWTGLLSNLYSGEIDVAAAGYFATSKRQDYFDFSWPVDVGRTRLYIKEPTKPVVQWSAHLKVFSSSLWLSILITIVISSIILNVIILQVKESHYSKNVIVENYLKIWGIYCQQGVTDYPDSSALKIAYLSVFSSALIIMSYYSATLTSHLTVFFPKLPFTTLEGFVKDGSYKFIVIRQNAEYDMFNSTTNQLFLKMKPLMKDESLLPYTMEDAIGQVCRDKTTFYTSSEIYWYFFKGQPPCRWAYILTGTTRFLSFALKKNSPLTKYLNLYLQKFDECGILKRIRNEYTKKDVHYPQNKLNVVELRDVASLLAIVMLGVISSMFLLCLERIYYNLNYTNINNMDKWIHTESLQTRLHKRCKRAHLFQH